MKIYFLTAFFILFITKSLNAQQEPIKLNLSAKRIANNNFDVIINAQISKGWHIYSQSQQKGSIVIPTIIKFKTNPLIILQGDLKETGKKEFLFDKITSTGTYFYKDSVEFIQLIKFKAKVKTNLKGYITYQTCTDEQCLPPKTFSFDIEINNQ